MRALVTGATGFVGAAVARALTRAGWDVRALVRASSDRGNLLGLDLEEVRGDLADRPSLEAALDGCQALFHVAADYRLGTRDPAQLYRTNVEGTRNILDAARTRGVERIIYTSSVATIGIPRDGSPGTEITPVGIADMIGHYKRSKYLAEELVREAAASGAPVIIVNPSTPVGAGDIKPTPTGQIILDAAAGRTPAYVDTGLNIAHVDDVAMGHLQAWAQGRYGERYILGGVDMTLKDILGEIARLVGRRAPSIQLPHAALLPIAYAAEAWARVTGSTTRVSVESVRMARKRMFFSSAKAAAELGYRSRSATEAFTDAIEWFRLRGLLQPA